MLDTSDKKTKLSILDDLSFIRVMTSQHIPRRLIESLKHCDYNIDEFYKTLDNLAMIDEYTINPLVYIYVIADKDYQIKGFLWFTIEKLINCIIVQNFAMDKEYWGNGANIQFATDFLKSIAKKLKITKAIWNTRYPKVFEKHGFKRSKNILMEFEYGSGRSDGKHHSKTSANTESSTAGVQRSNVRGSGAECPKLDEPIHTAPNNGEL